MGKAVAWARSLFDLPYLPDVNNPTSANVDALIEKSTQIPERLRQTFRAELFNATSHVVFSGDNGIPVNAVMPGMVATPGTTERSQEEAFNRVMGNQAIKKRVQPEHLAGLIAFSGQRRPRIDHGPDDSVLTMR